MKIRLEVKILSVSISSFWRGLQQGGEYRSLKSVIQVIESRKAYLTLRSAERAPTLSAARKLNSPFSKWRGVFLFTQSFIAN